MIRICCRRVLVALLLMGPAFTGAASQEAPDTAGVPTGYRATAWSPHAHGTVVAMVLEIPAGSVDDQTGFDGTAALLAQVLGDQISRALGPEGGSVSAVVDRGTTTFTLLALPDAWPRAAVVVDSVVFEAPIDDSIVDLRRSGQLQRLAFESDSPGAEFQAEAAGLLAAPGSAWARPVNGVSESVSAASSATLELYRSRFYRRVETTRAIVGPASLLPPPKAGRVPRPDSVPGDTASVAPAVSASAEQIEDTVPKPTPPTAQIPDVGADTTPALAWSAGSRTRKVRDVTSTWIRVAYPLARSTSRTAAEMLADLVHDELDPTPPDPDRYGVEVRLIDVPGGTALVVDATVFPEAADRWEAKITGTVAHLASGPMQADLFGWRRRRFRTERLLEEAPPEVEAARMTGDLLRDARPRDLAVEIWGLEADALYQAAKRLGPPRILLFGPDLGQEHGTGKPGRRRGTRPVPRHP